jgi:hypothetical protein
LERKSPRSLPENHAVIVSREIVRELKRWVSIIFYKDARRPAPQ